MIPPPPRSTLFPYTTLFRSLPCFCPIRTVAVIWRSYWTRFVVIDELAQDRKSTRLNSSHGYISYAVFCLKKKKKTQEVAATGHKLSERDLQQLAQLAHAV